MSDLDAELMKLAPSAMIELFVLDTTNILPAGQGSVEYFHAGTNELRTPIVFQENNYQPWPVTADGFAFNGDGSTAQPTFTISNINGVVSSTLRVTQDLVGAQITRKRTFARFLDGMPNANPTQEYPLDIYYISRKASEEQDAVMFELTTSFDLTGVSLPSRQVLQNSCGWVYKSAECSWVPVAGFYFDSNDVPVSLLASDICGQRLDSCACRFARFGTKPVLPFGGFPGAQKYV
jgi:lambda family phage minor tail protein L